MMEELGTLYEVQRILAKQLDDAVRKMKGSGEKLSAGDLDYVDKLTHAVKSVKTTIAMCEAEDNGMSFAMRTVEPGRDNSYRGSYDGGYSGRRGRSSVTGRYVSRSGGYSGHEGEYMDLLQDAMEKAPDEQTRRQIEQLMNR